MKILLLLSGLLIFSSCVSVNISENETTIFNSYIFPKSCLGKDYFYKITFENHSPSTTEYQFYYAENKLYQKIVTNFGNESSIENNEIIIDNNILKNKENEKEIVINNTPICKIKYLSETDSGYHLIVSNYCGDQRTTESIARLNRAYFSYTYLFGKKIHCYIKKYDIELITTIQNKKAYINKQEITDYYAQDIGLIRKVIKTDNKLNSTQEIVSIK